MLADSTDAYLYPGHVQAIMGTAICKRLLKSGISGVVAGFTAAELLTAIATCVTLLQDDKPFFCNCYPRVVTDDGSPAARVLMQKYMEPIDAEWRGIGMIPGSGLKLRNEFSQFDARLMFDIPIMHGHSNPACRCGEILRGSVLPSECPLFGKVCTPEHPIGACMVSREGELEQACRNAIGLSHIGSAIVESYIGGSEYGAEAIVIDGIPHVLAIIKKQMTEPPFYAELGHTIPNDLDSEVEANAIRLAENVIRALGINFGAVNMDLKISTSGEVHLVDIGARMGGNMIGSHIIPYGTGIDYMKGIICSAMGDSVNLSAGEKKAIASKLLAFHGGVVRRLPDFVALEREYEVEIHHHLSIGDIVHSYRSNLDGCGYVIACGGDAEDVQRRAAFVRDKIEEYIFQES